MYPQASCKRICRSLNLRKTIGDSDSPNPRLAHIVFAGRTKKINAIFDNLGEKEMTKNKKRQTAYGYRTKDMHIRLTEEELLKLQALADDFEMTESEFIRWSVFQRKVTMRIIIDDEKHALAQIRHQLDRIGNNINQIAKLVNTGYVNPEMFRIELKDMFKLIHDEIDLLNRVQSEVDEHWKNKVSKYSAYYVFDKTQMSQKFNGFY